MALRFEDIHSIFNGRENITNLDGFDPGVSFDCLLNCIDGIQKNTAVILFISTNDISVIDSALFSLSSDGVVSRPGRIDMAVEFQKLDDKGKRLIANVILKDFDDSINEVCNYPGEYTAAQFEEMCKQKAKNIYQEINSKRSKS